MRKLTTHTEKPPRVFLPVVLATPLLVGALLLPAQVALAGDGSPPKVTHPLQGCTNCLTCHGPGKARPFPADHEGNTVDSCFGCHEQAGTPADPSIHLRVGEPSAGKVAELSANCRVCHVKTEFHIVSNMASGNDTVKQLNAERSYAHRFVACVTCHGSEPHAAMHQITKRSIAAACGQCHGAQRHEHEMSVHGKSIAGGGKDAATCIDCHSTEGTPHSIARSLSPDSPAYRSGVATTCARCHSREDLMGRYGLEAVVYKTYLSNFHGKANVLSPYEITQHPKATCVTCHGYHEIRAKDDPKSPVNKANLAATCGGCHPGAGKKFAAAWMGHKEATPKQYPAVYLAERFFFALTSSVLTFGFVFMVGLPLGARLTRRQAHEEPPARPTPPPPPPPDPAEPKRSKDEEV